MILTLVQRCYGFSVLFGHVDKIFSQKESILFKFIFDAIAD